MIAGSNLDGDAIAPVIRIVVQVAIFFVVNFHRYGNIAGTYKAFGTS